MCRRGAREGTLQKAFNRRATLVLLVLLAVFLRAYNLASPMLWADEAESSLNALTIVAEGLPGDHFLGQPLYENTLIRPWPESAEYEFRDLSYSDRGLAVYHSWLPLYAIAAAFRLSGVSPASAQQGTPLRDASQAEIDHWTMVPRLPAVALGALSVVAVWALGRRMHSLPAAIALAFAVATSDFFVYAGRQARYYSASVAGSTLSALAIWHAWQRGRLSDHALVGLAVGVLFHIHSVSAVAMAALYVVACPMRRDQPQVWLRMLTAGTVGAVLVLPWAAWSGLLSQPGAPAALRYIDLQMVLASLPGNAAMWATLSVALVWLAAAARPGSRISEHWRRPILDVAPGLGFALCWLTVSWLSFFALMPAASFFPYRLNLMIAVPLMLASSLLAAAIGRAVRPAAAFLPVAGMVVILVSWSEFPPRLPGPRQGGMTAPIAMIRDWTLGPGGRIFASPGEHLVLTYYSGRPIQSIAPVRREWLDHFGNDLIILESSRYVPIPPARVHQTAQRQGRSLSEAEAQSRANDARILATRLDLEASGVSVVGPPARHPDSLDDALVDAVHEASRRSVQMSVRGTLFARDAMLSNWHEFRHAFYYWFSNPAARTGAGLNYRRCRDEADAIILPNGLVVLDCRTTRTSPLVPAGTGSGER